jgi:hypothetical protein
MRNMLGKNKSQISQNMKDFCSFKPSMQVYIIQTFRATEAQEDGD